ncbi:serine/threonine-protein kinase VRK1-like [Onthophagus taurus]|uniref:serine/threonine-protein kinase VRK1-like n=1 Tax=Onthophagus taurus TaxID=166361 RepID=UPI0039BE1F5D
MPPKKRANDQIQDLIRSGEVLEDVHKKKWKLGNPIGKGGFGLIYLAQELNESKNNTEFSYVVKIEPHGNGPLFVEMNFLMRNAKQDDISAFMKENKLKSLGMPRYISSGSHLINKEKYRFLVLERFGDDISKLLLDCKNEFPIVTVFKVALQIVDVLEYIHSRGYVHHDIKGANILLDLKAKKQIYLMDYGLTGRYFTGTKFKRDPKKAHDGTLEYVSRDGHDGVQTRRGDLEVLGYNIIQWLGCTLPWEKVKNPVAVQTSKSKYMDDIPNLMETCFKNKDPPKAVVEYLVYLNNLNFDSEPNYKNIRNIFINGIKSNGGTIGSPLVFQQSKTPTKRKLASETPSSGKKTKLPRRKLNVDDSNDEEEEQEEKPHNTRAKDRRAAIKNEDIEQNGNEKVKPEHSKKKGKHANAEEKVEDKEKNDKPKKKIRKVKNIEDGENREEEIEPKKKTKKVENVEDGENGVEGVKPKKKSKKVENVEDGENGVEGVKPKKKSKKVENVEDAENGVEGVKPKKKSKKVEHVEDGEAAEEAVKPKKKIGNNKRNVENQEETEMITKKGHENKKGNEVDEEDRIKIKPSKKKVQETNNTIEDEKPSSSRYPKRTKK